MDIFLYTWTRCWNSVLPCLNTRYSTRNWHSFQFSPLLWLWYLVL